MTSARQRIIDAIRGGWLVFGTPVSRGGLWVVEVKDTRAGQTVEKSFPSNTKALEWIADQMAGVHPHLTAARGDLSRPITGCSALDDGPDEPSIAQGLAEETGARVPDTSLGAASGVEVSRHATSAARRHGSFALRAVREVLEEHELDPTIEIVKVLKARRPVFTRQGAPVIDKETGEQVTEPVLDADTQAKTLLELQQYVTPKLKAVEVIDRTPPPRIEDLDTAILGLIAQARRRHGSVSILPGEVIG